MKEIEINVQVAILCNHQRSVPKKHEEGMEKLKEQMEALREEKTKLQKRLKDVLAGKKVPEYEEVPDTPKKKKVSFYLLSFFLSCSLSLCVCVLLFVYFCLFYEVSLCFCKR
jgi:hypothetical protein